MARTTGYVDEIQDILQSAGFDRVYTDAARAELAKPSAPTKKEIEFAIGMIDSKGQTFLRDLPGSVKKLQKMGIVPPLSMTNAVATQAKRKSNRKKNKGLNDRESNYEEPFERRADIDTIEDLRGIGVDADDVPSWTDYKDAAQTDFDPDFVTVGGYTKSVDDMQRDLLQVFDEEYLDMPNGVRFAEELEALYEEVFNSFNDAQMITLYGLFVSGQLFADFTQYDSNGDGENTRGLFTLKQDIALARSAG